MCWQESDLLHTRYSGCRTDAFEGDRFSGAVDATVKWCTRNRKLDRPTCG